MIVSLDELKRVLGLELTDTSEDDNLTRLINAKTTWVEGKTHRRFDTPIPHSQYENGGNEVIYLDWHVDDSVAADNPSEALDPTTSVRVFRRARWEKFREWEELIEGEDWERRDQAIYFLRAWQVWPIEDEIRIDYLGGYAAAPEDIKEVIIEMAMNQYMADADTSSGTSGLSSEKLGDYSYSVGSGGAVEAVGTLSNNATATLARYTRKFV